METSLTLICWIIAAISLQERTEPVRLLQFLVGAFLKKRARLLQSLVFFI